MHSTTWNVDFCIHTALRVFASLKQLPIPPQGCHIPSVWFRRHVSLQQSRFRLFYCAISETQPSAEINSLKLHCTALHAVCVWTKGSTSPPAFLHLLIDLTVLKRLCLLKDIRCEGLWTDAVMQLITPQASALFFFFSFSFRPARMKLMITAAPTNILSGSFSAFPFSIEGMVL